MMLITVAALAIASHATGRHKFHEKVQEVQYEYDYAPTIGRRAEPAPQPLVPVRYLTPEQRAEPILVDPAPVVVYPDDKSAAASSGATKATPKSDPQPMTFDAPTADKESSSKDAVPSYITSIPSGSATGSTAVAQYDTPAG